MTTYLQRATAAGLKLNSARGTIVLSLTTVSTRISCHLRAQTRLGQSVVFGTRGGVQDVRDVQLPKDRLGG